MLHVAEENRVKHPVGIFNAVDFLCGPDAAVLTAGEVIKASQEESKLTVHLEIAVGASKGGGIGDLLL